MALTSGDPAGIGFDIALDAWLRRNDEYIPAFYLLAQREAVEARSALLGHTIEITETTPAEAVKHFENTLPIVTLDNSQQCTPGRSDRSTAAATIESIDSAVGDVLTGLATAVVTLPIAKKTLHEAGFAFPGHTEYLAHLAEKHTGRPVKPVMMLAGPELRAIPVTIHVALADVPSLLTPGLIVETCRIASADLKSRIGIDNPRLAIAGLNPHAGEGGAFGNEDETVVRPAVEELANAGLNVVGPLPADTMFHPAARSRYDAAICMYHDQALIPAKTLDFDRSVNVTLGLPFVRTSPDHGTAFEIAGSGKADPQSLIEALRLAEKLVNSIPGGVSS